MIQTEEARNNGNMITNGYRALVDTSLLDLLSITLDTVPLQNVSTINQTVIPKLYYSKQSN